MQNITFGQTSYKNTGLTDKQRHELSQQHYIGEESYDSYKSTRPEPTKPHLSWAQKIGLFLAGAGIGSGTFAATTAIKEYNQNKPTCAIYETVSGDTAESIGKTFNISPDAVLGINGLEEDESIPSGTELTIPQSYSKIQNNIDNLRQKLYSDKKLSGDEIKTITETITNLEAKKAKQDEVALVYTDGEFVYLQMNDNYLAEDVKGLFGIKDGALRRHNNLDFTWRNKTNDEGHDSKDFTESILYQGLTYKVRINDFEQYGKTGNNNATQTEAETTPASAAENELALNSGLISNEENLFG